VLSLHAPCTLTSSVLSEHVSLLGPMPAPSGCRYGARAPSLCINLGSVTLAGGGVINLFGINVDEICTVLAGEEQAAYKH